MAHFLTFPDSVTQSARRYVVKAIENVGLSVSIDPSEPDFVVIRASFDSLVEEVKSEVPTANRCTGIGRHICIGGKRRDR